MSNLAKSNNLSGRKSDKKPKPGNKSISDQTDSVISGAYNAEKTVRGTTSRNLTGVRKTWKAYLFDFFMLFLAVFCGFVAQWQLERSGENQREIQFISSLAEDLKRDTMQINLYIAFNENILAYCDSLQLCIRTSDIYKNSNQFYNYSRELARYIRYYPTDRTMQQLKNAGNMRLIRKWKVSNAITEYDGKTKLLMEFDQQLNNQVIKYREYLIEFIDLTTYDRLNPSGSFMGNNLKTQGNPGYLTADSKTPKMIYNQIFTLRTFLNVVENSALEVKLNAKDLVDLLQKEYNLKPITED